MDLARDAEPITETPEGLVHQWPTRNNIRGGPLPPQAFKAVTRRGNMARIAQSVGGGAVTQRYLCYFRPPTSQFSFCALCRMPLVHMCNR